MDSIDGTNHYEKAPDEQPASLLTIILDTNPYAWAILSETLPLSKVVANLLVFINAHIAFNQSNKVAVIASHVQRAEFLYPLPLSSPISSTANGSANERDTRDTSDIEMEDAPPPTSSNTARKTLKLNGPKELNGLKKQPASGAPRSLPRSNTTNPSDDANIYRPFHEISTSLYSSLSHLFNLTTASNLSATPTTSLAGALTLALTYINKQTVLLTIDNTSSLHNPTTTSSTYTTNDPLRQPIISRILILSVSSASPTQYIPLMNTIFASQRLQIPIDILALSGSSSFLQQASDATNGIYICLDDRSPSTNHTTPSPHPNKPPTNISPSPHGILQYLLMAYLPDALARQYLILPTQVGVDFRAACFCHRRVVDIGFVCSICLSIFCEPPEDATCYTCGTHLVLGSYGAKPVVRRKKKKKRRDEGEG